MGSLAFTTNSARALLSGAPLVTVPPFTVAGWARPTSFASIGILFYLGNNSAASTNQHRLAITSSADLACVSMGAATGQATTANTLTQNVWHHCAGVWASPTSRRAILAGDLTDARTNATSVTPPTPTSLNLGSQRATGSVFSAAVDAQLENWAVWDVALTDAEVVALSKGVQPCDIRPSALRYWWRSWGRAGGSATVPDIMGNGELVVTGPTVSDLSPIQRGLRSRMRNLHRPALVGGVTRPRIVVAGL